MPISSERRLEAAQNVASLSTSTVILALGALLVIWIDTIRPIDSAMPSIRLAKENIARRTEAIKLLAKLPEDPKSQVDSATAKAISKTASLLEEDKRTFANEKELVPVDIFGLKFNLPPPYVPIAWMGAATGLLLYISVRRRTFYRNVILALSDTEKFSRESQIVELLPDSPFWLAPPPWSMRESAECTRFRVSIGWPGSPVKYLGLVFPLFVLYWIMFLNVADTAAECAELLVRERSIYLSYGLQFMASLFLVFALILTISWWWPLHPSHARISQPTTVITRRDWLRYATATIGALIVTVMQKSVYGIRSNLHTVTVSGSPRFKKHEDPTREVPYSFGLHANSRFGKVHFVDSARTSPTIPFPKSVQTLALTEQSTQETWRSAFNRLNRIGFTKAVESLALAYERHGHTKFATDLLVTAVEVGLGRDIKVARLIVLGAGLSARHNFPEIFLKLEAFVTKYDTPEAQNASVLLKKWNDDIKWKSHWSHDNLKWNRNLLQPSARSSNVR